MRYIVMITVGVLVLAGCRGAGETYSPEAAGVDMELSVAPNPPMVGNATLVITLTDVEGQTIDDATVRVRGDMDHAGMQPVLAEAATGDAGDYVVPFEWTMGGDWFVVVTATLPDGRTVEQQFDYSVEGEMDMSNSNDS